MCRASIWRKLHWKLQKIEHADVHAIREGWCHRTQIFATFNTIYGESRRCLYGFLYHILDFLAESDSVNNSYQWKSPFIHIHIQLGDSTPYILTWRTRRQYKRLALYHQTLRKLSFTTFRLKSIINIVPLVFKNFYGQITPSVEAKKTSSVYLLEKHIP